MTLVRRVAVALAVTSAAAVLAGAATPTPSATADPVRAAEYWLDGSGITDAWTKTRGAGVRIAVIDTGVGYAPEIDAAVVGGTDVSGIGSADGRTPVGATDANHGSWVASLAAARGTGPSSGMIGVAPEADILSVSVDFSADAEIPLVTQIADGIRWSVDNGAKVINLSFTTNTLDWDRQWDSAFQYAFAHDVVVIAAAGNRGSGTTRVGAPSTIPGVFSVAGVDRSGSASLTASTQGITIGVSAPSEELLGVSADGRIVTWSGTSGAAPIVAGVAALVRAAHPQLDAANVIQRMIATARKPAGVTSVPDKLYGYGLVDAAAAVTATVPLVAANPMGDLAEWIRLYRRADSTPAPSAPNDASADAPPLPEPDAASTPTSPLLPTADTLRYGTVPLVALTVPVILVALGVAAAVRRIRSTGTARTDTRRAPQGVPPT